MYFPPSNFKEPTPHVLNTWGKPCICGNLALLYIFSNFGAVLGLTGVSSIEFFCYTVLVFLPLVLPPTYSLSLECSRYNASSTSNSTDIRASEELRDLSWLAAVVLVLKLKKCCFINSLCFFNFSGYFCPTRIYSPYHCCLFMFSSLTFF